MANLIIKSSADDLVLKGSGGNSAITVGSTGNTTLAGTANNLGTVTAGTTTDAVVHRLGASNIKSSDGSVTAMACDTAGRITQPAKPSFKALMGSSNVEIATNTVIPFTDVTTGQNRAWNIGGHYNNSTYKFTAPVAGIYYFGFQCYSNDSGTQFWVTTIYNQTQGQVIGRQMRQAATGFMMDDMWQTSALAKLSVNDEVYCKHDSGAGRVVYGGGNTTTSFFEGCLIG